MEGQALEDGTDGERGGKGEGVQPEEEDDGGDEPFKPLKMPGGERVTVFFCLLYVD